MNSLHSFEGSTSLRKAGNLPFNAQRCITNELDFHTNALYHKRTGFSYKQLRGTKNLALICKLQNKTRTSKFKYAFVSMALTRSFTRIYKQRQT
jgi:phage regulator Rha-like protein